jgi:methylmalonyl-CoA/ethylmalonyl-CoA epimerase
MFERYTDQARRVIFFARYEASQYGAAQIDTEHLLLALAREDGPLLSRLLGMEEPVDELRGRLEGLCAMRQGGPVKVELPLGQEARAALHYASEESGLLAASPIGTEHLLLGLLRVEGTPAEQVLREAGLTVARARESLGRAPGATSTPIGGAAQAVGGAGAASNEPAAADASTTMKIEHIGIATARLDDALRFWRDALGLEVVHTEVVEEQGVRVAMLPAGEPRIELLEPTGENSPVAKFLEKRGPGIHHVAVRVPDIRAALARLKDRGARLIDDAPRVGAGGCLVAFVHPQSAGGVLLELVEHARAPHQSESER